MIKDQIYRMQRGEISWNQFFENTSDDWTRLAAELCRLFRLPLGVQLEDVTQETKTQAFKAYQSWDRTGGQPLHKWVTIRALQRATDWLNRQRQSKGWSSGCSRAPIVVSDGQLQIYSTANQIKGYPPQLRVVEARQRIAKLVVRASKNERLCIIALVDNDLHLGRAARAIYSNPTIRLNLQLDSPAEAAKQISSAVRTNLRTVNAA